MPLVAPTLGPDVPVAGPAGLARIDPSAAAAPANALAGAAAQVGGEFQQWSERYTEARRQADAADIVANGSKQLGDAQFKWSKEPDNQRAYDGFLAEAGQIKKDILGGLSDPLMIGHITRALDEETISRALTTRNTAWALESNARRGALDNRLAQYSQDAASAENDVLRAQAIDRAQADIKGSVAAGWLLPEEGTKMSLGFTSRVQEAGARALMNRDTSAAVALLSNPRAYPGLDPDKREVLLRSALRRQEAEWAHADAAQRHQDTLIERETRRVQSTNSAALVASALTAKDADDQLNPKELADLVASRQISEAGMHAVLTAQKTRREGVDDPMAVIRLNRAISTNTALPDDIDRYLAAGLIKPATAVELARQQVARYQHTDTAEEKALFDQLKTALGGHTVEQGMLDLTKEGPRAQAALWAQAQGEWTRRVITGKEDPRSVTADMLSRYQRPVDDPRAWPQPRLGAITSLADVDKVSAATAAAVTSGTMSQTVGQDEAQLLARYRAFYQRQAAAAAARPAQPSTSTSRRGGLAPAASE